MPKVTMTMTITFTVPKKDLPPDADWTGLEGAMADAVATEVEGELGIDVSGSAEANVTSVS